MTRLDKVRDMGTSQKLTPWKMFVCIFQLAEQGILQELDERQDQAPTLCSSLMKEYYVIVMFVPNGLCNTRRIGVGSGPRVARFGRHGRRKKSPGQQSFHPAPLPSPLPEEAGAGKADTADGSGGAAVLLPGDRIL